MPSFIHRHNLRTLVLVLGIAGICTGIAVFAVAGHDAVLALADRTSSAMDAHTLAGLLTVQAVVATLGLAFALFVLLDGVDDLERAEVDRALTALYGVPIERHAHGVWKVDGELRHAVLTSGPALLVGGRELPRVSA